MPPAHKLAATVSVFVALSVSPACAEVTEEMAKLMQDGLNKYAEVAGKVASCIPNSAHRMDDLAEQIATWRYPSWWDGVTGTRDDYAESLKGIAFSYYLSTLPGPCPGLPKMYESLAAKWITDIETATRTKE